MPNPKKQDEFISLIDRIVTYAQQRTPIFLLTGAVVLLVVFCTLFWRYYHSNQKEKLANQFYEIQKKTPEEQKAFYGDMIRKYRYAPLGVWMSLELANLQDENCQEMLKTLEDYLGHGESAVLRGLSYMKAGVCLEDGKEWEKARELYERAYGDGANPLKDQARLREAFVLKAQGQKDEAKKVFEELSQENAIVVPVVRDEARLALLTL